MSFGKAIQSFEGWRSILVSESRGIQVKQKSSTENGTISFIFSPGQLREIESAKLSDIFCSDSDNLELVADNVFRLDSERVSCQDKPGLNLRKWALDCSTQI